MLSFYMGCIDKIYGPNIPLCSLKKSTLVMLVFLSSKKLLVDVEYKQPLALVNRAQTMYIFPTALYPCVKFFWKFGKLKGLLMSPKTHSTIALTELIFVLNCRCSRIRCNPLNCFGSCGLNGYFRSP